MNGTGRWREGTYESMICNVGDVPSLSIVDSLDTTRDNIAIVDLIDSDIPSVCCCEGSNFHVVAPNPCPSHAVDIFLIGSLELGVGRSSVDSSDRGILAFGVTLDSSTGFEGHEWLKSCPVLPHVLDDGLSYFEVFAGIAKNLVREG